MTDTKPFAVVTGASTGIGWELARCCCANGFSVLMVANEPAIHAAAARLKQEGAEADPIEADLSTTAGVDHLYAEIEKRGRGVDALLANAGVGLGNSFLDQDFARVRAVIDTNITGTIYLIHRVGQDMRRRGSGRILITGSIAGFIPGAFQAVYNASKAFLDSFSWAIRNELKDTGVTVTCLMPGATETEFFRRADLLNTQIGQADKDDPAMVAQQGFEAMMKGEGDIVTGLKNKLQVAVAHVTPSAALAEMHRHMAEPDSAGS